MQENAGIIRKAERAIPRWQSTGPKRRGDSQLSARMILLIDTMGAVFTALGKAVTRQPIVIIVLWAILTGFAGTAAMTGFGDTPLFSKLETGQPTVPGSDSAKVDQFLYSEAAGVSASLMIRVSTSRIRTSKKTYARQ